MEANIGALTWISDLRTGQMILRKKNTSQFCGSARQPNLCGDVMCAGITRTEPDIDWPPPVQRFRSDGIGALSYCKTAYRQTSVTRLRLNFYNLLDHSDRGIAVYGAYRPDRQDRPVREKEKDVLARDSVAAACPAALVGVENGVDRRALELVSVLNDQCAADCPFSSTTARYSRNPARCTLKNPQDCHHTGALSASMRWRFDVERNPS